MLNVTTTKNKSFCGYGQQPVDGIQEKNDYNYLIKKAKK